MSQKTPPNFLASSSAPHIAFHNPQPNKVQPFVFMVWPPLPLSEASEVTVFSFFENFLKVQLSFIQCLCRALNGRSPSPLRKPPTPFDIRILFHGPPPVSHSAPFFYSSKFCDPLLPAPSCIISISGIDTSAAIFLFFWRVLSQSLPKEELYPLGYIPPNLQPSFLS